MTRRNLSECSLEFNHYLHDADKKLIIDVDVKPHQCDTCGKAFNLKTDLCSHLQTHIQKDKFVCGICKLDFIDKIAYDRHCSSHSVKNQFTCVCGKTFTRKKGLTRHNKIHLGEKYFCELCNKGFATKTLLNGHRLTHTEEKPHVCDICSKCFILTNDFLRHYRICEKTKRTKVKNSFHSDNKGKNSTCSSEFSDKIPLDILYLARTRNNGKPFVCDICKESFTIKDNLSTHYRLYPEHKPYPCNICKKSFVKKNTLIKHYRFHTKEKPHVCDVCGKGFYEKDALKQHIHYSHTK